MVSTDTAEELHISEPRINDRIRVPEVRLVGPNGEQVGIVRVEDALRLAQEADLDLVEVAPQAKPPVCKLMDYGKFKYEAAIKDREARKNQSNTVLKTVRLRLKIDPHDYATKMGMATKFLGAGDKVKVMIMFRGREQSRPEMGYRLLQRFATDVAELGAIESSPQQDGRNMVMVIGPLKRKADAKAEQKRRRDADAESAAAGDPDALVVPAAAPAEETPAAEAPTTEQADTTEEAPAPEAAPVAEAPAPEAAPVAEAPATAAETPAPVAEAPAPEAAAEAPAPEAAAPEAPAPKAAAPKAPAPKAPAPKAPAPKAPAPRAPAVRAPAPKAPATRAPSPAAPPRPSAPAPKAPAAPADATDDSAAQAPTS